MPGRLKVRVVAGRRLPVMDRASDLTDAFVEVKFGSTTFKTEVYSKSLNPMWNSPWYKFEVNDENLQDEMLQVRVLDHDTYSSHDAIGKVTIDIDPLLDPETRNNLFGWFPIYDTMHGIRGEILLQVKLELFADSNRFRQSSCGFKFICAREVLPCYKITAIHGLVHELLVREDPEYKWIDKLRTPRASNEARQRIFSKMSGELQRHIGRKVENVGGNAVIGFQQSFDLEGESGIVARGIGTAVTIETVKYNSAHNISPTKGGNRHSVFLSSLNGSLDEETDMLSKSNTEDFLKETLNRRSIFQAQKAYQHPKLKEFPFLTLRTYPANFITRLSVIVKSHSVKYLDGSESESRELWWSELRQEVKGHCLSLACNAVVGYSEKTSICDEVMILTAQGSAAVVDFSVFDDKTSQNDDFPIKCQKNEQGNSSDNSLHFFSSNKELYGPEIFRAPLHMTDQFPSMHFRPSPLNCEVFVPEILLSTIDIPSGVPTCGKPALIQARYCKSKRKLQSESNASLVSDILPFVEYELHKQLCNKLKLRCMNALFGLECSITLGENLVVGIATGTGVLLEALATPTLIDRDSQEKTKFSKVPSINLKCLEFVKKCKEKFELYPSTSSDRNEVDFSPLPTETGSDISSDGRKSFAIEVEDVADNDELVAYIQDQLPPENCFISSLGRWHGDNDVKSLSQTFSLVRRVRYNDDADDVALNRGLRETCEEALSGLWFRILMKKNPCQIFSLRFYLVLSDDDELQIWISGSAVTSQSRLEGGLQREKSRSRPLLKSIKRLSGLSNFSSRPNSFRLDDVRLRHEMTPTDSPITRLSISRRFMRSTSLTSKRKDSAGGRLRHLSDGAAGCNFSETLFDDVIEAQTRVDIVPMTCVPGCYVTRHIGILNMFVIRETTSVRGNDDEIVIAEPANGTGSNWFVTRTLAETNALIRAHVVAIGGSALTSYSSSYRLLKESETKNEAQILFHFTGDIVVTQPL